MSFVVNKKSPQNYNYFDTPLGTKLSKFAIVIGSNASGKTNLLKVLPFLKWLILDSFKLNPQDLIPIKTFKTQEDKPTELSATFEVNKKIYTYKFVLNKERILEEKLLFRLETKINLKNKFAKKNINKIIFKRIWNEKTKKYILEDKNFNLPQNFENLLRSNSTIISIANQFNHQESRIISNYWESLETMVGNDLAENLNPKLRLKAFNLYYENKEMKSKVENMLSKFDINISSLDLKREQKENNSIVFNVDVLHKFNETKFTLPLIYESSGTQKLFIILSLILPVLNLGGVVVIDELDINLHPDIIIAIYELFISKETNPNNAQFIFSSHSHRILNELDKYQIFITEKNNNGSCEVYRLSQIKGIRSDDNYYMKYIAGAYGGIPNIN